MYLLLVILIGLALAPFVVEWMRAPMGPGPRQAAEGRFVDLPGGITHYDWIGPAQGPVVVCVHGLTTPSFVWRGVARGLVTLGFRVLIYDLYGRGLSDRPRGAQHRQFFLNQLDDLLADQNAQGRITLIGYSMGGSIATAWASAHPDRIRQLILIASAGIAVNPGRMARYMRMPGVGDWLMRAFFARNHAKGVEADRGVSDAIDTIVDRQQAELRYRGFVPAVLSSLRGILSEPMEADFRTLQEAHVPVLEIWGRDDPLIPVAAKERLGAWMHDSRQEVIDGADHSVTFTHTPEVLAAIRDNLILPDAR